MKDNKNIFMFFKKKTKNINLTKRITIYISDKYKQIIIVPRHENNAGIIYEQDKCFIADTPINLYKLGAEVIFNLNLYSIEDTNLRDRNIRECTAFKNSKVKTISAFEKEYIPINVGSVNNSNLILEIEGLPYKESELTINSTISFYTDKEELGKRIMKIFESCLSRKIE